MKKISLKIKRIDKKFVDVKLPGYETEGSAGMDIRATLDNPVIIQPGKISLIPTNLKMEIPLGYEVQVRPRSGLAIKHGIGVLNSPGTIDSDYRGEVKIILFNFGDQDFAIKNGDRVAQIIIAKVTQADIEEVNEISDTERGSGGFGHTGRG